jgi:uncharacterized repeat protein (TIGR03943 family)
VNAVGGTISVLVGTVLLRLTVTGIYQRYVRVGMGPWLAIAGAMVIVLGLSRLLRASRAPAPADQHSPGHDDQDGHEHGDRVGWLLLAPIAALLLVAPPALGSYGVDRGAAIDVRAGPSAFEPLPAGAEPVPMTLLEFNQRAYDRDGASLDSATVQLTGFVADDDMPFRLARYQIACCAVDAAPVVVLVVGTVGEPPPLDQWITVTGTFRSSDGEVPEVAATSVVEIPAPDDPYE